MLSSPQIQKTQKVEGQTGKNLRSKGSQKHKHRKQSNMNTGMFAHQSNRTRLHNAGAGAELIYTGGKHQGITGVGNTV